MLASVLCLLAAALLAPGLDRLLGRRSGWLLAAVPAALFAGYLLAGPGLSENRPWFAALHLSLAFHLDGWGRLFALLITGIGSLVVLHARAYLDDDPARGRFLAFLFLFMASMLGLVLADNLILFFLFWELTSISSYLLIGHHHEKEEARWNALQALLVTGFGGLALLAGLILLGGATGQWEFSGLATTGAAGLPDHPHFPALLVLILLGALTKSAQFPFHFWLPNAMAAPTPASAYLHSATMVKAGIFLLAKLSPVLAGSPGWTLPLVVLGALTAALGAGRGLRQTDLKKILAYTTLSVLGLLTMLVGVGTPLALQSALLLLFGHALYKAALFLAVGNIDHATGSRDVTRLGGLRRAMPWTMVGAGLAALSMCGFPPFFGFLGKEYVYKSSTLLAEWAPHLVAPALFANMLLLALALKVGWHPFWSRPGDPAAIAEAHEAPPAMWLGPLLLGAAGLLLGLFPQTLLVPLLQPALAAITGSRAEIHISAWHGISLPLLLSVVTVAGGILLFAIRRRVWRYVERLHPEAWTLDHVYRGAFHRTLRLARLQSVVLQSGSLRRYLTIVLVFCAGLLVYELSTFPQTLTAWDWSGLGALPVALFLLAVAGAALATASREPVILLVGLGAVGFAISAWFTLHAAPDLAVTQLLVETLTVVLFVLVLTRLPRLHHAGSRGGKLLHAAVAGTVGLLVSLLLVTAQTWQVAPLMGDQFGARSYAERTGRNVVNVILVDFRALDTLGEITVLGVAAIGVATLAARRRPRAKGEGA